MKTHWAKLNGDGRAAFKIYDELFTTPAIDTEDLLRWLSRAPGFSSVNKELLLKELALMMVIPRKEHYVALGERQSIFLTTEDRNAAWALFQTFKSHFNFSENYHALFSRLTSQAEYDLIYLDESQSFTPHQLFQIMFLAKDCSMLAGFDRHQRIHGDRRNMSRFEALCHDRHIPLTNITLSGSFRCPRRVIELINNVLDVKYALAQGRPDKKSILKYESKKPEMGQVHLYNESSDMAKIKAHLPQNSTNWAVITSPELKAQAERLFETPLIFTPEEILGLGYDLIVLYHLGQNPIVTEMSRELNSPESKEFKHGAKKELKESYLSCLNQWIIAASRSHQGLLVVEPRTHAIRHFINRLFPVELLTPTPTAAAAQALVVNTDWESEILRLMQYGLYRQAQSAYERNIQKDTGIPYQAWYESKVPSAHVTELAAETPKLTPKAKAKKTAASTSAAAGAPTPVVTPLPSGSKAAQSKQPRASVVTMEMYKYAGLRFILDRVDASISSAAFYNQHVARHFNMDHRGYCQYIRQAGVVPTMKCMIDQHSDVSMRLESSSREPLFLDSYDYCEFLSYKISPESPPFLNDFLEDEQLERIIDHMVAHPEHLSINFLIFLATDILLTTKMISQKSKLEKLICQATISYFDIVLEKEDEFFIENTLLFNNFFLAFITLAIKLVHHHESGELIDCILHAPMIWRFLGASRWADIPVEPSSQHHLLFIMLFYPKSLRFLEVMLVNYQIPPYHFLEKILYSKNILRYLTYILTSELLTGLVKEACEKSTKFYQALREKIIAKTIIDHFLQQPNGIHSLLKLIDVLPNLWEGSFASPEVVVYQSPKKTQQSSLILKLMIDSHMSGIPGMQEKVLELLHAGTNPLFLEFNDTEWILPMILDSSTHKYSWLMSPLFLMAKYPIYHAFLKELLMEKPHLACFLKWLNHSSLIGMNALEGLLSTSALGSEIFAGMMGADNQTYHPDALFPDEHLILKTNVESFCRTL